MIKKSAKIIIGIVSFIFLIASIIAFNSDPVEIEIILETRENENSLYLSDFKLCYFNRRLSWYNLSEYDYKDCIYLRKDQLKNYIELEEGIPKSEIIDGIKYKFTVIDYYEIMVSYEVDDFLSKLARLFRLK